MLHQGAGTGPDPTGDEDLAARSAVRGGVATVTEDRQFCTGVQPPGIGRRRAMDHYFRAFEPERADPLPGVPNLELEWRAIFRPEGATDIVMTGRRDFKFRLAILQGRINLLQ